MSFGLYFDEDQDEKVALRLIKDGYDVLTTKAAGRANQKISDENQLRFAAENARAIVTRNRSDFYGLYSKWWNDGRVHAGIIVVSPRKQPSEIFAALVAMQSQYPDGIENLILLI